MDNLEIGRFFGPNQCECDAILFDLEGILIDSTSCTLRQWQNWADQHAVVSDGCQALRCGCRPLWCLEDAPAGVIAGKKAGMRVIGITSTHTPEELLAQGADLVLDQLSQLTIRASSQGYRLVMEVAKVFSKQ